MTEKESTRTQLRNEARPKLLQCGINADDVEIRSLPKAIAVYDACIAKKEMYRKSFINYSNIEEATGITRKTLSENPVLSTIIKCFANETTEKHDNTIRQLKDNVKKLMDADRHHKKVLSENYPLESDLAFSRAEVEMLRKEKATLEEALSASEKEVTFLKQQLASLKRYFPVDTQINAEIMN